MLLILFILNDADKLDEILNAWTDAGVSGITIFPSTGMMRRAEHRGVREDIPLIPRLEHFMQRDDATNRTLVTLVETEELADQVVTATQRITGDLDLPHTGILIVLPVARAYGLHRKAA